MEKSNLLNPNTLYDYEDALLFAFVHGGTKAEENKDPKLLKKNFNALLDAIKHANVKKHTNILKNLKKNNYGKKI